MMSLEERFARAFETRDIERFLSLMFPWTWHGVAARIIESGAEISDKMGPWAPRWTAIPPTVRHGKTNFETNVKSCIFRVHDCIHQLWGLPIPSADMTEADFYLYKRAQMCGEVAVLAITEFEFCTHWYDAPLEEAYLRDYPSGGREIRRIIEQRNAVTLLRPGGALNGKSMREIAARLDAILHKKRRPTWVRESTEATAFADDYVPMLDADRKDIDHNWRVMKAARWLPLGAPNARYASHLDGLELTCWMIDDFGHLMNTDDKVDEALRDFNRERRARIVLPAGWHHSPQVRNE